MGAFALCVESATRDIRSLLTLHRVHPQVRTDIQRILSSLLRKSYEHTAVPFLKDLTESPEQVCRELVNNIVEDAFKTALSASDMHAMEHRCIKLEQDNADLKAAADQADKRVAEVKEVLSDLKKAHDYMLHSYFREVLVLRHRIDDLQRHLRTRRVHTMNFTPHLGSCTASVIPTMEFQLQQFPFNPSTATRQDEPVSSPSPSTLTAPPCGSLGEDSDAGEDFVRQQVSTPISPCREECAADLHVQMSLAGSAPAALVDAKRWAETPRLKRKARDTRITFPVNAASRSPVLAPPRAVTMPKNTPLEVFNTPGPESVDAIFDYEEYVRLLNGKAGVWVQRFADAMNAPERGGAWQRHSPIPARTRLISQMHLLDSSGVSSLTAHLGDSSGAMALLHEREKASGFYWLLHLALEPIQHKFHIELDKLRQAVEAMQREHAEQVQLIQRALLILQSRTDALLDFLNTFAQQTRHTLSVVTRDVQAQSIIELLSSGALPVAAAETVASFFTPASSAATPNGQPSPSSTPVLQLGTPSLPLVPYPESSQGPTVPHLLRRKWRLKPGVALQAQTQASAMASMNHRLRKAASVKATCSMSDAPTNAAEEVNYYRADLGLSYWSAHPVTSDAQRIFGELQEIAAAIRATRVQQLYAFEENATSGGRPVGRKGRRTAASSRHGDGNHHRCRSPHLLSGDSGNASFFYFRDGSVDGNSVSGPLTTHHRLREGWRTAPVSGADGQTAADLLRELAGLRMRRACDQRRLKVVQASLLQGLEKDPVAFMRERAAGGAADPEAEAPHLYFSSSEGVLRTRALQQLRTRTQQRLRGTSQHIAELQKLLDLHCSRYQLESSEDLLAWEVARRIATEGSRGQLRVKGTLNPADQLWSSPYLNDTILDANDQQQQQQQQQRGAYDSHSREELMYLPIGMAGARGAVGNCVAESGRCIMLGSSAISAASLASASMATSKGVEGGNGDAESPAMVARITPFVAVMDYCRGVQLGRPLGRRAGPVYLFQDHASGDYYVGDQAGRNVLKAADDSAGNAAVGMRGEADTQRSLLPMTRILFPAPIRPTAVTTTADVSSAAPSVLASVSATAALHPTYLVPMAIPLSDEEAVIREGWQACHRHGHARCDPIYYMTVAPLPLSKSYHHVVPQPGNSDAVAHGKVVASAAAVAQSVYSGAPMNRYLRSLPCVFQPADEAAAIVRVRAMHLQQRQAANESFPNTAEVDSGPACASSGLPSTGITANLAATATPTLPSLVRPLSGYAPSSPEVHLLDEELLLTADLQESRSTAAAAPLPGSSSSRTAALLALSPSSGLDTRLATMAHDSAPTLAKAVLPASAAAVPATSAFSSTDSSPPLTAALVLAKERRNARLAKEAAHATQAKMMRQKSLRNQSLMRTAPNKEGDVPRAPPHRLFPLSSTHSDSEAPFVLPFPTDSARLQRQIRPEKYSLKPPPPSSRWREVNGGGINAWNLNSDAS
ncbi:hypothetical protein NXY56_006259 [Leishmania guyanensis]|uniref:Uncharacterized protein n=1 Tax=Leishmania guyanensis TaxID=5670 RepID=A0A1E1J4Z6_LEIGU|nr:hypothetical protein, conserved [Leishmania guyanensis]